MLTRGKIKRITKRAIRQGRWARLVCRVLGHRLPAWAAESRRRPGTYTVPMRGDGYYTYCSRCDADVPISRLQYHR